MTEKRFSHKDKSLYIDDDYFCELEDGDEISELLNRQQYTVETVSKENEKLKEKNRRLEYRIVDMLDYIKKKGTITHQEMKEWWNTMMTGGDVE